MTCALRWAARERPHRYNCKNLSLVCFVNPHQLDLYANSYVLIVLTCVLDSQILVAEICLTLLQFSLHHPTITNTSATTESPTEPLYASEKLPSALVTRLARVAHNAPAAVKDSSLDDILYGTDVSFGAGNSYGVFDGLAPQHYLYSLPVGTDGTGVQSPPQSPGKSIRGMYSSPDNQAGGGLSNTVSPNFGYAVHSAEDDEDEF